MSEVWCSDRKHRWRLCHHATNWKAFQGPNGNGRRLDYHWFFSDAAQCFIFRICHRIWPCMANRRKAHVMVGTRLIGLAAIALTASVYAGHANGQSIKRDSTQRAAFVRANPCPATGEPRGACPGWVVDHIKPLACGGADDPSNMQWQTTQDAKEKDRWERKACN